MFKSQFFARSSWDSSVQAPRCAAWSQNMLSSRLSIDNSFPWNDSILREDLPRSSMAIAGCFTWQNFRGR